MNINPVDQFRNDFFEKLIKEEKAKEQAKLMAQKQCFHKYNIMGLVNANGYQERSCSKCGHSALKSVRVWEGSKNGECVIS
jgi:hypothetical protein